MSSFPITWTYKENKKKASYLNFKSTGSDITWSEIMGQNSSLMTIKLPHCLHKVFLIWRMANIRQTTTPDFAVIKIINNNYYWKSQGRANIKIFSVASRSIISMCQSHRLSQITELQDTKKSQHFAKTKFNNCFKIWSTKLFSYLDHSLTVQGNNLLFFTQ